MNLIMLALFIILISACSPKQFSATDNSASSSKTVAAGAGAGAGGTSGVGADGGVPTDGGVVYTPNTPTTEAAASLPIDPYCDSSLNVMYAPVMIPYVPLGAPNVPATCNSGFELQELMYGSLTLNAVTQSQQRKLVIDIATYTKADSVHIFAMNATGKTVDLIRICRSRTANYGDPTGGNYRPPEDSIRRWEVTLPAGTTHFTVDNSAAVSPTYIRVLGLCDFNQNVQSVPNGTHYRLATP